MAQHSASTKFDFHSGKMLVEVRDGRHELLNGLVQIFRRGEGRNWSARHPSMAVSTARNKPYSIGGSRKDHVP
jgi:hypothetical protein